MATMNAALPPAPPPPYFDDDDMLDDYIDGDDFGGPPPPAANATANQHHSNEYEEDYWEDMMEIEGRRQLQQQEQQQQQQRQAEPSVAAANATPTAAGDTPDNRTTTGTAFEENETENATSNENEDSNSSSNNDTTVEEYLAARRQENNLYNYERFEKRNDWRTATASSAPYPHEQQQSRRRRQRLGLSEGTRSSKTVAPEARFLRLLEANRGGSFYRNTGSNTGNDRSGKKDNDVPRLRLQPRSSGSGNTKIFRSPPREDSIRTVPVTLADGSRVHVLSSGAAKGRRSNTAANDSDKAGDPNQKSRVLGVSMKELFRRVDENRKRNIIAARRRIGTAAVAATNHHNGNNNGDYMLWVDKHAPRSFPHLLSDEKTNREVLRALRGWDPYVFQKPPPLRPLYQRQKEAEQQQRDGQTNADKHKTRDDKGSSERGSTNASDKRPEENARVILLSGPPGVGKTTLAHIVARHAGYRPVEVNASDERSSGVLKDRIQRAMESTTLNFRAASTGAGGDKDPNNRSPRKMTFDRSKPSAAKDDYGRPNCLILDEIDGADARGSIQALVDIVKAEIPSKSSKQKQNTYLRRPIICICNHKYAPALRPLLPYAAHFNVEPPSSARLVARLKAILNEEKNPMIGGGPLLHQLVVSSGGDIRSSLFTLQFAAARATDSKDLSEALTNSLSGTGLKDNRNDIASTISAVFRKTKPRTTQYSSSLSSLSSRDRASVSRVMNAVDGLGDDSAAVNALFMNVLRVSYIDPAFDRCSAAHELLSFAAESHHHQSGYAVPVVTAGIHLLCRVEIKPDLTFSSRELADLKYQRESNLGLVQKFSEGLPTKAKNLKCNALLAEEFIPLAMWVLSAGEGAESLSRAASSIDILTKMERGAAENHVAALGALGLTYAVDHEQQERTTVASSFRGAVTEMRMEPPIHRLVEYTALCHPGGLCRREIPSKMKELLAHQVLLESFRSRHDPAPLAESPVKAKKLNDKAIKTPVIDRSKTKDTGSPLSPARMTPRKLDRYPASASPIANRITKSTPSPTAGNFLGIAAKKGKAAKSARRAAALGLNRSSSKKQKLAHSGSGFLLTHVVRMKYVKGFTQAVRTPCRLNDLE